MGLPINKLILATNENDILSRFFKTNIYEQGEVAATLSPSMDIQVASNFERYLYYRFDGNSEKVIAALNAFKQEGRVDLSNETNVLDDLFIAECGNTADTLRVIQRYYKKQNYLLDPHTAVGVAVAEKLGFADHQTICLATAHPAKFESAIQDAVDIVPTHPRLEGLDQAETRCDTVPANEAALREYIAAKIPLL